MLANLRYRRTKRSITVKRSIKRKQMNKFWTSRHANDDKFAVDKFDTLHENEWDEDSIGRMDEDGWKNRYNYEAALINHIIKAVESPAINSILELGPGPGLLSQIVLGDHPNITYHLIDKKFAKKYFDDHNFKGEMFVKDLSIDFNTDGLLESYDLVITNDFLEHVLNPSIILQRIRSLMHDDSRYLISNPNWRMGHQYVYRGLFDFDNFMYMLRTHGFEPTNAGGSHIWGSPLVTAHHPKLDSERTLPDNMITSWNHYLLMKKD